MTGRVVCRQRAGALIGMLLVLACAAPAREAGPGAATAPRAPAAAAAEPNAWEQLVVAAKQEGKMVIAAPASQAARDAVMEFQKAYPDIAVEYLGLRGAEFFPRLVAERQADQYLFDVHIGGAGTPAQDLKPLGFLDPLDPELVLPDITEDKTWLGGFREAFYDRDRTHVFAFQASLWYQVYVNRDLVPVAELTHVRDLVLPRWSGKIASDGVNTFGGGCGVGAHWLMVLGEESFRQLYLNDVTISRDRRQIAEWVIRGRYPIVLGIAQTDLTPFLKEGLGQNVRPLEPDSDAGVRISVGQGNLALISRPPHPNARKLFVSWLLSREGQSAWARYTLENSRRLDVTEGPPETRGDPQRNYLPDIAREENLALANRCVAIGSEIFK